ncbi:hypothetical protein BH11BAC4_BH11BAC4_09270 [soil metagenome]
MKKAIFTAALIAGTLDILAAFIQSYLMADVMPSTVLKYIASGVFGKPAFSAGAEMIILGLLFHFIIAFACTFSYFLFYPKLNFLKQHWLFGSILIAIIAWAIPNWIIIPMSHISKYSFQFSKAFIAITILFFCVGIPIAYSAHKFYTNKFKK